MADFNFTEMFPLAEDTTEYRKLTSDYVGVEKFRGQDILTVEPEAFTMLTEQAFRDISHLLRPAHLQQLRNILEDDEATSNEKFVAHELLKNAAISAGGALPTCMDTRTAIAVVILHRPRFAGPAQTDDQTLLVGKDRGHRLPPTLFS